MKKVSRFSLFMLLIAATLHAQEILNNDSVVKMVKSGLPESIVAEMVRNSPGRYELTADRLIELKRLGVPSSVLTAMMAKNKEFEAPAGNVRKETPSGDEQALSPAWNVHDARDKLTQELHVEASRTIGAEHGAKIQITAACGIGHLAEAFRAGQNKMGALMQSVGQAAAGEKPTAPPEPPPVSATKLDERFLSFRLHYMPGRGSGLALEQSPLAQTVNLGGPFAPPTVSAPGNCVFLGVLVDKQGKDGVQSNICNVHNAAEVYFPNYRFRDLTNVMMPPGDNSRVNDFVGTLMNGVMDMKDPYVATMNEALGANEIRVELPLTDGDSTVLTIQPQEPSFRSFASRCLAVFPDPVAEREKAEAKAEATAEAALIAGGLVKLPKADRLYSGTLEGFLAAFPGFVQRAAASAGLDTSPFDQETVSITNAARTCSQITPEAARSVPYVAKLGPQYMVCEPGFHMASKTANVRDGKRHLAFMIPSDQSASNGEGFRMTVLFSGLTSDNQRVGLEGLFDVYGIVSATIRPPE